MPPGPALYIHSPSQALGLFTSTGESMAGSRVTSAPGAIPRYSHGGRRRPVCRQTPVVLVSALRKMSLATAPRKPQRRKRSLLTVPHQSFPEGEDSLRRTNGRLGPLDILLPRSLAVERNWI